MQDNIVVSSPPTLSTSTLELRGRPSTLRSRNKSPIRKRKSQSPVKNAAMLEKGLNEFEAAGE